MAENLTGDEHVHDFSHPYRGYLMCSDDYCGEVRTTAGEPLTEDQSEEILEQIRAAAGLR